MDEHRLTGSWSLVSFEIIPEGGAAPEMPWGQRTHGRMVFTPNGRMIAVVTGTDRRYGPSDAERAALHRTMVAYSGTYRIEGEQFITTVDVSGNPDWEGTEQVRTFSVNGSRLVIDLRGVRRADGRMIFAPQDQDEIGQRLVARLVWEQER